MRPIEISLRVNGAPSEAEVEPRLTLADFIREHLHLTGTHLGCEHGVCGACTVLVNGAAVRSCLMLAVQADGSDVLTIEGLAGKEGLHEVQAAFRRAHSFQCGFCTPGFVMSTYALVGESRAASARPTRQEIRRALSGNLCRCTGYETIVDAVEALLVGKGAV